METNNYFKLGEIVITLKAFNTFSKEEIHDSLERYKALDFGKITENQLKNNKVAVAYKGLILGKYKCSKGMMTIYTSWGRYRTTICLEEEFE